MDAFSFSWREVKGYAFPPFNLIGHCIWKMKSDQASLVLICPMWPSQVCVPSLLETLTDVPRPDAVHISIRMEQLAFLVFAKESRSLFLVCRQHAGIPVKPLHGGEELQLNKYR